jgi:3-phenylpropionate/trans-cinnamate dioxygenase ferredoxin reductase subunit
MRPYQVDRIVIIGAGQAAAQAVATLRAEAYAGALTVIGDEPFPPYQRPPLSKAYLSGEFTRDRLFLRPDSFYAEAQCTMRLDTRATAIDRAAKRVQLSDGASLPYDRLLIATGARVRTLPLRGAELSGVHYLRSIADVDALRNNLVHGCDLPSWAAAISGSKWLPLPSSAASTSPSSRPPSA